MNSTHTEQEQYVERVHRLGSEHQAYFKVGTGPAVVIVHGVGGHKEDWRVMADALSMNHTVYAVDMLGFGGSSRNCSDLKISAQAAAIRRLLESESVKKATLIGNSVGGWVTATFAASYPEMIDKLVLIDPAGFEAMFKSEPVVNLFPENIDQMGKLLSYVIHSEFAHTEQFAAKAFSSFEASGERGIVPVLWPGLLQSERLETVLSKVNAPTLIIWGKEDKLFPLALCPYLVSLTPNAKSAVIANAGHFVQLDQPALLFGELKRFL